LLSKHAAFGEVNLYNVVTEGLQGCTDDLVFFVLQQLNYFWVNVLETFVGPNVFTDG